MKIKIHQTPSRSLKPMGPLVPALSIYEVKRVLCIGEYVCKEFPHIDFIFQPTGDLDVKVMPDDKFNRPYEYSVYNTSDGFIMEVSPELLETSGKMKLNMMGDHLTLSSLVNPEEQLHLTKRTQRK